MNDYFRQKKGLKNISSYNIQMEQIQKLINEEMDKMKSMTISDIEECIDEALDGTYEKELIFMNQLLYDVRNRMRWFSKISQEDTYLENYGEMSSRDLVLELKSLLVTGKVKFNAYKIIDIDGITTMHLTTDEFSLNGTMYDSEVFNQRYSMEDYNAMMNEMNALRFNSLFATVYFIYISIWI